jgi:hypothetical protein
MGPIIRALRTKTTPPDGGNVKRKEDEEIN